MNRLLVSAAAVALLTSGAIAADIPVVEELPVVAPVATGFDWSGFYTGGFVGYGWANVEVDDVDGYNDVIGTADDEGDFNYDTESFYFGTLIGYNLHWDWFLLGVEAEIGRLEFEDEQQLPDFEDDPDREGDSIASVDVDTFGNVSGRLGLTWNNVLLYGKGGFAFADVEVEFEDSNVTGGSTLIDGTEKDEWLYGWTAGGGVEVGFWENWTVRGEYMYTDLEEISHTADADLDLDGDADAEFEFEHELEDIHTVKLGVTRRF